MADILTQEEIDSLLDVTTEPEDLGSVEFENLYSSYIDEHFQGTEFNINGINPETIMYNLDKRKKRLDNMKIDIDKFYDYYDKFHKIAEEQPEIFI